VKAEILGVAPSRVFDALQVYLGSSYVNDFNYLGRTYRVTAQAESAFRDDIGKIVNLKTRNDKGQMVPIGSVATFRDITGPYRVPRYNLYPAAEIQGNARPGYSTGDALAAMEKLAAARLPDGFASNGPNSPTRKGSWATPASLSSPPRSSLFFSRWRRSTKAGACHSRSS